MLTPNITATATTTVTDENTAKTMGSGSLKVFATPAMVALMEKAACACVEEKLDEGMTSVGTMLDIKHLAATPKGMEVKATATLTEIDGRRLVFDITVSDGIDTIGSGRHERFIVNAEKFMGKAYGKKEL